MKLNYRWPPKLDNTVWYFGCSITWGEFCEFDESAPNQLSKLTGLEIDNLGICGGSPDLIYFQIQQLTKIYTPKMVIIQWPTDTRTYKLLGDEVLNLGVWVTELHSKMHERHPKIVTQYQKNILNGSIQRQNKECMDTVHTLIDCPLITFKYQDYFNGSENMDLGTDNRHPGPKSHRYIAEMLSQRPEIKSLTKDLVNFR
jgi:hypothetical protein